MKFFAACVLALLLVLPAQAGQPLEFSFINAPLSASSLAVLKAAYAKLGIRAKGKILPSARALAESDAGRTDGEVHRIKAIEKNHPSLIRVDVPINTVEGLALTCHAPMDTTSPDNIKPYRIGIKIGTRYAEILTEEMPHVSAQTHEDKLMQLLRSGRLDIVIGDRPWANSLKREPRYGCLVINEPPLATIPLYHYLHRRHAALVPDITRVLRRMKQNGEMQIIRDQSLALTTP